MWGTWNKAWHLSNIKYKSLSDVSRNYSWVLFSFWHTCCQQHTWNTGLKLNFNSSHLSPGWLLLLATCCWPCRAENDWTCAEPVPHRTDGLILCPRMMTSSSPCSWLPVSWCGCLAGMLAPGREANKHMYIRTYTHTEKVECWHHQIHQGINMQQLVIMYFTYAWLMLNHRKVTLIFWQQQQQFNKRNAGLETPQQRKTYQRNPMLKNKNNLLIISYIINEYWNLPLLLHVRLWTQ